MLASSRESWLSGFDFDNNFDDLVVSFEESIVALFGCWQREATNVVDTHRNRDGLHMNDALTLEIKVPLFHPVSHRCRLRVISVR